MPRGDGIEVGDVQTAVQGMPRKIDATRVVGVARVPHLLQPRAIHAEAWRTKSLHASLHDIFQRRLALPQIIRKFVDGHLQGSFVGYAVRGDFVPRRRHGPKRAAEMLRQFTQHKESRANRVSLEERQVDIESIEHARRPLRGESGKIIEVVPVLDVHAEHCVAIHESLPPCRRNCRICSTLGHPK